VFRRPTEYFSRPAAADDHGPIDERVTRIVAIPTLAVEPMHRRARVRRRVLRERHDDRSTHVLHDLHGRYLRAESLVLRIVAEDAVDEPVLVSQPHQVCTHRGE
jgi:hypothetical protein